MQIVFIVGFSMGCIETFEVSYELNENAVVIAGRITDIEPAYVEITRTSPSPLTDKEAIPRISGASVVLVDDLGERESLIEQSPGNYVGQVIGIIGRAYRIEVTLNDGSELRSSAQVLKASPSIDSLYTENVEIYLRDGSVELDNRGLNLNLNIDSSDTVSQYYRWTVGGTYIGFTAFNAPGRECNTIASEVDLQPCYITLPENSFFVVGESEVPGSDRFSFTLKFIPPSSQFAHGHSILVTQYSLTEEAYSYWKKIDDQSRSVGSIFDPPPSQITGNLEQVSGDEKTVLGFFEATSVKRKRIFVERSDFETLEENSVAFSDLGINAPCFEGWSDEFRPYDYCCDCSYYENSTRVKPSFWE